MAKWSPESDQKRGGATPGGVPGRSWGRLGALLGSTCGLGSFLHPLRPFLGRFLASCGAIHGLLGANFRFLGTVLVSVSCFSGRCSFPTCPFAFARLSLFHLSMSLVSFPFVVVLLSLCDSSMVLLVPGPCGLRAARLNPPPPEGSERVRMDFEIVFEFLFEFFELKESSQGPRIPQPSRLLNA